MISLSAAHAAAARLVAILISRHPGRVRIPAPAYPYHADLDMAGARHGWIDIDAHPVQGWRLALHSYTGRWHKRRFPLTDRGVAKALETLSAIIRA